MGTSSRVSEMTLSNCESRNHRFASTSIIVFELGLGMQVRMLGMNIYSGYSSEQVLVEFNPTPVRRRRGIQGGTPKQHLES
jgi:hypothetical protein